MTRKRYNLSLTELYVDRMAQDLLWVRDTVGIHGIIQAPEIPVWVWRSKRWVSHSDAIVKTRMMRARSVSLSDLTSTKDKWVHRLENRELLEVLHRVEFCTNCVLETSARDKL